jgi:hypothetical protein
MAKHFVIQLQGVLPSLALAVAMSVLCSSQVRTRAHLSALPVHPVVGVGDGQRTKAGAHGPEAAGAGAE